MRYHSRTITINTDVDIDMSDISTDVLMEELERREPKKLQQFKDELNKELNTPRKKIIFLKEAFEIKPYALREEVLDEIKALFDYYY